MLQDIFVINWCLMPSRRTTCCEEFSTYRYMRCISQPRKCSSALCSLKSTRSSKLPLLVAVTAFLAGASQYPKDVELSVYSGDTKTCTPDRFGFGIKPVPRSEIANGSYHPSSDT